MDYGIPRANDICHIEFSANEDAPCATNPLGIKGCGEAGTIGAKPALMNAIVDALEGEHVDMPATLQSVWRAAAKVRERVKPKAA